LIFWACGKNEQSHVFPYSFEWICSWNEKPRRPKKRWIDTIREDCDEMKVDLHTTTHMAHDRRQWRESVNELLTRVDETSPRQ